MLKNKRILGLINARGGSKGVPGKNIKLMNGKPLIGYSIECGKASRYIDRLLISTDDPEIANVAKSFGADVPFLRPLELASDTSKQIDAIIHAVGYVENQGELYDYVCVLQPTCPLRQAEDVDGTLELLISTQADSAITVTDVGGRHPRTLYKKDNNCNLVPYLDSDAAGVLRQNFEDLFWRTGAVYAMKRDVLINRLSLYGDSICGYVMPEERCFNIDSPFDWNLCEAYMMYTKS
jgi:CMP-N,N'-diacetyllegionaminic acid synthase